MHGNKNSNANVGVAGKHKERQVYSLTPGKMRSVMTSVEDNLAVQQQTFKNIHSLGPSHSNSGKQAQGNKKKKIGAKMFI